MIVGGNGGEGVGEGVGSALVGARPWLGDERVEAVEGHGPMGGRGDAVKVQLPPPAARGAEGSREGHWEGSFLGGY